MSVTRLAAHAVLLGSMILGADLVSGQNYPTKPVRIVSTEAGGSGDTAARFVTPEISGALGQPVIVENRPGANVTGELVARAMPDGYTLLIIGNSFWLGPLLQKTPYDPVNDFSPITLVAAQPNVLVVHPSVPVQSVKQLIALAKAKPGELNYGTTAVGGALHLAAELLKSMAGVNIVGVPYKGFAAAFTAVLAGEVQVMFPTVGQAAASAKSGRLRVLAITSAQQSALAPELPTVAASGLPGYEAGNVVGMFAPARTPATIIAILNPQVVRALNRPDVKQKFFNTGAEVVGNSPEQFAASMKAEMSRMGKVIKDAGIKVE